MHNLIGREKVHLLPYYDYFSRPPRKKRLENIAGKGENEGNQHSLHFPQCFFSLKYNFKVLSNIYFLSAYSFNLDESKNLSSAKGLIKLHQETEQTTFFYD